MKPRLEDYNDSAKTFVRSPAEGTPCLWCKHPDKPAYRVALCRHCYNIRIRINRYRKLIETYKQGDDESLLKHLLSAAIRMEEDAKVEGRMYENIPTDDITGIRLEREFSYISGEFVHSDLYRSYAGVFDRSFTPDQKRLLFYLLSLMSRARLRRTRWNRALGSRPRTPLLRTTKRDEGKQL